MISRPSIKLAGVDSVAPGFKFKTMALTDEVRVRVRLGLTLTLTLTVTLTLTRA